MKKLNLNVSLTQTSLFLLFLLVSTQSIAGPASTFSCDGIQGGNKTIGREGTSKVITSNYQASVPIDAATEQTSDLPVYRPLIVSKLSDVSSPFFLEALATGKVLNCTITMYEINTSGEETAWYTVNISGAKLVGLNFKNDNNFRDINTPGAGGLDTETLAFKYTTMSTTFLDGNLKVTVTP